MENIVNALQKFLDVNIPLIYIDDYDYTRIDEIIKEACGGDNANIVEWNPVSGRADFFNKEPKDKVSLEEFLTQRYAANSFKKKTEYVVLRDVGKLIENDTIISLLSHIAQRKLYDRNYDTSVIISDFGLSIPQKLHPYVSIIDIEMPDDDAISKLIDQHLIANNDDKEDAKYKFPEKDREALMPSLRGLTRFEIDRVLDMAISVNGNLDNDDKALILTQKKAQVRKSGLLDLVEVKETIDDIGGLEHLKEYLKKKSRIMKNISEARKNFMTIPKGVFIVGMPGCGKSLCAKAAAAKFDCPLLKLDMGGLLGKYQGESEANIRRAIRIAEGAAPCVLWIDEIEKGFSGVGGSNDIMTRMFGYFLSWMQDKTSSVYVIATANNANNLPPELKRKGRFDEIFCVNLPNAAEREAIFKVHLNKRRQNIPSLSRIVEKTQGFNGADIESVVNDALEDMFLKNLEDAGDGNPVRRVELTEDTLLSAAEKTVSISKSCSLQIAEMEKEFAKSNFTNASV